MCRGIDQQRGFSYGGGSNLRGLGRRWDLVPFVGAVAELPSAHIAFAGSVRRSPGSTLVVAVLVSVALMAIAVAISRMVASAGSHLCHVFCSRHLFGRGLMLLTAAFGLAGSLLLDDPFRQLFSAGHISPLVVAEAGCAGVQLRVWLMP